TGGALHLTGGAIYTPANATVVIDTELTTYSPLTKTGPGTLDLTVGSGGYSALPFPGGTTVSDGTLRLEYSSLPGALGDVTIQSGATLDVDGTYRALPVDPGGHARVDGT